MADQLESSNATPEKRRPDPWLVAVVLAFALALALGYIVWHEEDGSPGQPFEARIPPADFLYLDGPRILSYLSQLEGGKAGEVHRISKEIRSIDAGAAAAGLQIGASAQREDSAESTITRTVASGLEELIEELRANQLPAVSLHEETLSGPGDLRHLEEGWLVRFHTDDLLSPGYIGPYVIIRQSATLAALFPQTPGNETEHIRSERQKEKAESFVNQVGPNPRITFAVAPPLQDGKQGLKLLLPMRYRYLTDERSLLEKSRDQYTGGELSVIGKVIRVFRKGEHEHCAGGEQDCPHTGPQYVDYATRETWRSPLEQASRYLIDEVSHNCSTERTELELHRAPGSPRRAEGRACFMAKLGRQTELEAPGAVILPLAIYK